MTDEMTNAAIAALLADVAEASRVPQPVDETNLVIDDELIEFQGYTPAITVTRGTQGTTIVADDIGQLEHERVTDDATVVANSIGNWTLTDVWDATGVVDTIGNFTGTDLLRLDLRSDGYVGDVTLITSRDSDVRLEEVRDVTIDGGHDNRIIIDELHDELFVTGNNQSISVDFGAYSEIAMGGFENHFSGYNMIGAEVEDWGVNNSYDIYYGYDMEVDLEGRGTTVDVTHADGATFDIWGADISVSMYTGNVEYEDNGHNTTIRDGYGDSEFELDGSGLLLVNGGGGDDTFYVNHDGEGVIAGGAGADRFEFDNPAAANMVLLDFNPSEGDAGSVNFNDVGVDLAQFMATFGEEADGGYYAKIGDGSLEVFTPNGLDSQVPEGSGGPMDADVAELVQLVGQLQSQVADYDSV